MPFQSQAQQGFLFANKPSVAKEFAAKTPKAAYKNLPAKKTAPPAAAKKKKGGIGKVRANMKAAFGKAPKD